MMIFKCKLRDEDVADAMLVEAVSVYDAAVFYATQAKEADVERYEFNWCNEYLVAVNVPGERPKLFEVLFPATGIKVTELKT